MSLVLPNERVDDLQRSGRRIIQDPQRFCFGMDAVLLSGFAAAEKGEKTADLGTGTGIIPILMEAKTEGAHFTGLEIQPESADMARRSVALNHCEEKITIVTGDLKEASKLLGCGCFDVVTSNPPYMTASHGLVNPDQAKAIARHEIFCTLEDVVREASRLLRTGGRFYMVHRPFRLVEIFRVMTQYKLEPKRMQMVQPYRDKEPNMVLLEAVLGGGPQLTVLPALVVYESDGSYTRQVLDMYGKP